MPAAALARSENLQQLRRLVPVRALPSVVRRRVDRLWADPGFREAQEGPMRRLVEHTERAAEYPELARGHAEHMLRRSYLRWHPRAVTHQPVRGIEWLTTARDPDRGIVLSFMHHAQYDGLFASLARLGPRIHAVMTPDMMAADAPIAFRQHRKVVALGAEIVPSTSGTEGLVDLLQAKAIVAIASDVPGRTEVTFLGRRVLGSFGAARIATMTNSPVVVVTTRRDADGQAYLQVEPPLEPADHDGPGPLLDEILRRHGEAVLAWPEAVESIPGRFGAIAD